MPVPDQGLIERVDEGVVRLLKGIVGEPTPPPGQVAAGHSEVQQQQFGAEEAHLGQGDFQHPKHGGAPPVDPLRLGQVSVRLSDRLRVRGDQLGVGSPAGEDLGLVRGQLLLRLGDPRLTRLV
jgi:hypothetical protein